MSTHIQGHTSLYHKLWFRILLGIGALDLIVMAFAFGVGYDFLLWKEVLPLPIRLIFSVLYIIIAFFILYYVLSYGELRRKYMTIPHPDNPDVNNQQNDSLEKATV